MKNGGRGGGGGKRQKRQNGLQRAAVVTKGCDQNTFGLLQIDTDPQRWRWPLWHICDDGDGGSISSSSIGGGGGSSSGSGSIVVVTV